MQSVLIIVIALIWLAGTNYRIYQQARFYQIEEYMSRRYLRWLLRARHRWLPARAAGLTLIGMVLGFFTDSIPGAFSVLPYLTAIAAAVLAVYPERATEVKKPFVRTPRATRILMAAAVVTLVSLAVFTVAVLASAPLPGGDRVTAAVMSLIGLLHFLLAPVFLVAGNLLMTPVEAAIRRRFIRQARQVMETVQPKVIGITGSYGKTTTKNFLRDILNGRYKTYATPKSYNTMMGVCLAINNDLADDYSVEYFISEMGAYIPGEIQRICQLTPPDISIVVEVGPQHLERFGSLQNIAIAKYEIIEALPRSGLGVFNWDNPFVRAMYERGHPENRIAVSKEVPPDAAGENGPRFIATDIQETFSGLSFTVHDRITGQKELFQTPVVGQHNVTNLLLATAVAVHEGMSLRDVAFRVKTLQPAESRLVRQQTASGITIINDAYSANPVGVLSALRVLSMHTSGRRLLVTPGMVELGELHEQENRNLGKAAASAATDIILVGPQQTRPVQEGIRAAGFPADRVLVVDTLSQATEWYRQNLRAGDAVLFLNDLPDTY